MINLKESLKKTVVYDLQKDFKGTVPDAMKIRKLQPDEPLYDWTVRTANGIIWWTAVGLVVVLIIQTVIF